MIADLENGLRELITEIVRTEVHAALAEVKTLDQYLPTRAAAKVADVAPGTIRRWIREGRLASHHAGRLCVCVVPISRRFSRLEHART